MDEAEAYVKRANRIRHQHFRAGFVSEAHKPYVVSGPPPLPSNQPQQPPAAQGILPPKKAKKRERSPAAVAEAPAAPTPLSTSGKPRISLIDKWFPGITLKQATVEACHAPPAELVAATVQRVTAAREATILLRTGVEDVEAVIEELIKTHGRDSTRPAGALTVAQLRHFVTRDTAPGLGEAFAQFAKETGHEVQFVRSQLGVLMRRKASVHAPNKVTVKPWHEYLNAHGPEAGKAPVVREFVWMSSASTTAFFVVLVQRFLRGVRESTKIAFGEAAPPSCAEGATGATGERKARSSALYINATDEEEEEDDANANLDLGAESDTAEPVLPPQEHPRDDGSASPSEYRCWLQATQPVLKRVTTDDEGAGATAALEPTTEPQCQLLVFLRYLMPVCEPAIPAEEAAGDHPRTHEGRRSCGYGVWLLACLVALDTPLDPDTDRLVHDLFRTCCDQVRVIGEWKGTRGEQPGLLLTALRQEETGDEEGPWHKAYTSLRDVGKAELLALYTIIIVLAKLFRQNQNRLIPL